ncbi:MAG: primosomal protein N' [Bacteroidales bacterium]|nr:primosomal protein N' [Bacteroidales bacterium]
MAASRTYISVMLPLKIEWEPCYYTTRHDIAVGQRVKVPFAGKEYQGIVSATGIEPQTAPSRIKEITGIEQGLEPVSEEEIMLWRKVAEYYLCSVGEVYKAAYPAGKISSEGKMARKIARMENKAGKERERCEKKAETLRKRISARQQSLEKKHGKEVAERLSEEISRLSEELSSVEARLSSIKEATPGYTNPKDVSKAHAASTMDRSGITLSEAQKAAYCSIEDAFSKGKPVLLNGVTGSGKTEIYISLAAEALRNGRNVLYLVPEIAISRQLEYRLEAIFGGTLLVFHSAESMMHRREVASAARSGKPYIVLGTRSAIFLPHRNLGLIIVDEEHDSSYKQESPSPRYNGRDAAIMLGGIMGSDILLGSATPSLESLYNCIYGRFTEVRLTERYYMAPDPDIEIIDTNAERRKNGMVGTFSRKLIDRISGALRAGGQVMILRTRRSYSPILQCTSCGHIPKCPHCNVSLSYHKDRGRMKCHYCGYYITMPCISAPDGQIYHPCPRCGNQLKGLGAGTQKIEEEAAALFPQARIARLDSDTAQNRTAESGIIKEFSEGRTDILIGTQIVAKGFDFKGLTLVAVMQADTLLGAQDFRADERAMQTLAQFRGRCGRRDAKGLFVIQTSQPCHPIYRQFAEGTADSTGSTPYTMELLSERKDFNYPPFTRIVNIIIKDRYGERAEQMSMKLHNALCGFASGKPGMTFTPPFSPAVSRIADEHIRIIRASISKDRSLSINKKGISDAVSSFVRSERYQGHISIDVDPS